MPEAFIAAELAEMQDTRLAPTANRSIVGIVNEFTFMAETARAHRPDFDTADLIGLARWLAATPCSPLFKRHATPDGELHALVQQQP